MLGPTLVLPGNEASARLHGSSTKLGRSAGRLQGMQEQGCLTLLIVTVIVWRW